MAEKPSWVAKHQMVAYFRCPNTFLLVDQGKLKFEDARTEFQQSLIANTFAWQEQVKATAAPVVFAPGAPPPFTGDVTVFGDLPTFTNSALRIRGRPYGIEIASGALYPIEVKFHKDVQHLDRLMLAFGWMLLEPRRSREVAPEGRLVLCRNWQQVEVAVPLAPDVFAEVHDLLADIRKVRKDGTRRWCSCPTCSLVFEEFRTTWVQQQRNISTIFGIDRVFFHALQSIGCCKWDDLLELDPADVVTRFRERERKVYVSERQVESWQLHARAFIDDKPMLADDPEPFPRLNHYIVLDLEYESRELNDRNMIWLIGTAEVGNGPTKYKSWWAENPAQEKAALQGLQRFLNKNSKVPIVTWNGKSADIPVAEKRASAYGLSEISGALRTRHLDLFDWVRASFRLPTPTLDLKSVSEAFGFEKVSRIRSGMEAVGLYHNFLRSHDPKLKKKLSEYNQDDLDGLAIAVDGLARLVEMAETPAR